MTVVQTAPRSARSAPFHTLTVTKVEQLTDDSAAITFDVPAELADDYAFEPGQSLTLRRTIDGREERRSYSICATAGAEPRIGVREIPDGLFSSWLVRQVEPGELQADGRQQSEENGRDDPNGDGADREEDRDLGHGVNR